MSHAVTVSMVFSRYCNKNNTMSNELPSLNGVHNTAEATPKSFFAVKVPFQQVKQHKQLLEEDLRE